MELVTKFLSEELAMSLLVINLAALTSFAVNLFYFKFAEELFIANFNLVLPLLPLLKFLAVVETWMTLAGL